MGLRGWEWLVRARDGEEEKGSEIVTGNFRP
jgi:hypothetical protein